MDKTHILKLNMITDVEKYTNVGDEYVETQPAPYEEKVCAKRPYKRPFKRMCNAGTDRY